MRRNVILIILLWTALICRAADSLPEIKVDPQKVCFINTSNGNIFVPYGVNFDHDKDFRLIEEFWNDSSIINKVFSEIHAMNFNMVRIHVQQFKFQTGKYILDENQLKKLDTLIKIAQNNSLYIDLTGLGRYNGKIPEWYRSLDDSGRIEADSYFWKIISARYKGNTSIFCFDIQNEPVINNADNRGYTGDPFSDGYCYINRHYQNLTQNWNDFLKTKYGNEINKPGLWFDKIKKEGKSGNEIALPSGYFNPKDELQDYLEFQDSLALKWLGSIASAIKTEDSSRLITVGLCEINFPFSEYYSSFDPQLISPLVDFISIHIYPATVSKEPYTDNKDNIRLLMRASYTGKPIIVEEMFPLVPLDKLYNNFLGFGRNSVNGWISFYWGRSIPELKSTGKIEDAITADWIEYFTKNQTKIIKTDLPVRTSGKGEIVTSKIELRTSKENREAFLSKYIKQAEKDIYVDIKYKDDNKIQH